LARLTLTKKKSSGFSYFCMKMKFQAQICLIFF